MIVCVRALNSTDVVDHLNKVSDVKPTLHSWDKSYPVMVFNPHYMLLD